MITTVKAIVTVALTALAASTGLAVAANTSSPRQGTLKGHIEPSGHAKLLIHYRHTHGQKMRWHRWHFYRVPLKCKGGPEVARDTVKGAEGAWNKYADTTPFGGNFALINPKNHRTMYREHVSGKLINPNKARGVVRVSGAKVPLRGGGRDRCDSGRLHWVVRR